MRRIIFSRHGLRYPFHAEEKWDTLFNKKIVSWNFDKSLSAHLSEKGAMIELAFGQFLKKYLNVTKETTLKVIANSTSRTFETAQLLSLGLKPASDININCLDKSFMKDTPDFNVSHEEGSSIDINLIKKYDKKAEKEGVFKKINELFNLDANCRYNKDEYWSIFTDGWFKTKGRLFYSSSFSDILQLKYYFGHNYDEIFKSDNFVNDLKIMLKSKDYVLDLLSGDKEKIINSDHSIYKLIKKEFKNNDDITLIVGHDTNIASIFAALELNMPEHGQIEKYPIGSKLIFTINDDESFDLEYLFYTHEDIRNMNLDMPMIVKIGKNLRFKY
ncbi:histidine-type phosphatase [Mycoplasma tauri]|uniref:Histidine phosphatase family protein n=1 Tax=Mycoplasma tauri TaxID=547987 RepID=A0A953NE27_9MOLU|nr:histidine phosphatase family protein [Mycoplasma tauri]MBZ4195247.1 histidine phosphatase family protein [Mycoplasma tauri]MBZ4204469.1 histidine phosphatase family protein [Mycoplasma tauri]